MSTATDPPHGGDAAVKPKLITSSELRAEFVHHDPAVARVNNGSFGCCPASIIAAQQRHQLLFLRQPDHYYFNALKPAIFRTRRLVQTLINADNVDEVSVVDNATTAAAIVLQNTTRSFLSPDFHPGDAALILHYAYGAVKKSVHAYISRAGGRVIEAHLPFPVRSSSEIILEFQKALQLGKSDGQRIRLAVIDHITSMPCVVIPVKELVRMCRQEGVDRIFIDGAHAIGNVDIDVKDIGADFYTSNLHKWLFCPPSAAFLYCKSSGEFSDLHHPVVSHEYGNGLAMESAWIGTRDYSAQLVLPEVMEFVDRFDGGLQGIMKRNHEKVVEMAEMLAASWGTELGAPPEMCASLAMVGLPSCLGIRGDSDALSLRRHMRECFKVEVPIYYRAAVEGEVNPVTGYVRISHQVYNVAEDYYRLRDAVRELVKMGFTCSVLSK
ncbi:Probable L-cysteine desulfhydrase- chloroplastic [Striga hermonthica]|uniref:Probable L-cysteine desulfhydrase- chloroplastic n=1 Tax=Striga hermonthica TaxID=68872 RepID=A0A9N7MVH8_STRHE|nr:Probable L-cysteine desulfhydrase- chloroplastic [Striga hermonthica]